MQKRAPTKATRRGRHAGLDQQPRRLENETTTPGGLAKSRKDRSAQTMLPLSKPRKCSQELRACKLYDPAYFQQNCHTGTKGTRLIMIIIIIIINNLGRMWK